MKFVNFFFTKHTVFIELRIFHLNSLINKGEDSDEEDFEIKQTDNLLICGQADKEVCTLNAYSKFK